MSAELNSADIEKPETDNPAESESRETEVSDTVEATPEAADATATDEAEATVEEAEGAAGEQQEQIEKIRGAMQSGSSVKGKVIGWNDDGLQVVVHDVTAFCAHSEMELGKPLRAQEVRGSDLRLLRPADRGRRPRGPLSGLASAPGAEGAAGRGPRQDRARRRADGQGGLDQGLRCLRRPRRRTGTGAHLRAGAAAGGQDRRRRQAGRRRAGEGAQGRQGWSAHLPVDEGSRAGSLEGRRHQVLPRLTGPGQGREGWSASAPFIELEPGLSGLLPSSKMSIPAGTTAARVFRPGREVTVQVLSVDPRRQRISLGLEGDGAEGSRSDFEAYKNSQAESDGGFNALAAALSKIQQ